ncbi:hypothetical protein ACLKA7_009538 [Drosophila subpalustris]
MRTTAPPLHHSNNHRLHCASATNASPPASMAHKFGSTPCGGSQKRLIIHNIAIAIAIATSVATATAACVAKIGNAA